MTFREAWKISMQRLGVSDDRIQIIMAGTDADCPGAVQQTYSQVKPGSEEDFIADLMELNKAMLQMPQDDFNHLMSATDKAFNEESKQN